MTSKQRLSHLALLLALALTGCAVPAGPAAGGPDFGTIRQREWDELNRLKGELRWKYDAPVLFTFPGHGDVRVRAWYLEGGPGWEYVRAKFTYENTTDELMERVDVELTVLDRQGETVTSSRVRLVHPWGLPLVPGTFFTDEIRVPTDGAHLDRDGWHWTMNCRGTLDQSRAAAPARPSI